MLPAHDDRVDSNGSFFDDPSRWMPWFAALATAVVFWPALSNGFVNWDDKLFIVDNPGFKGLSLSHLRWMFTTLLAGPYQPLSWLTLAVDYEIGGLNPYGYHLTNLLLHAANAAVFCAVAGRLIDAGVKGARKEAKAWGAGAAALIFAIHPLRVESVAWVTERRDVLSGLFYFLAILFYLRMVEAAGARRWRERAASLGFFSLGLLSKGSVVVLPFILCLLDYAPLSRLPVDPRNWLKPATAKLWREKLPYWAMALPFAVVSAIGQGRLQQATGVYRYDWLQRIAVGASRYFFYLGKTLWPAGLSPVYVEAFHPNPWAGRYAAAILGLILATLGAVWLARRGRRWALACWLCYAGTLFPMAGFFQSGPQVTADRYTYLSCLPWAVLLGALLTAARGRALRLYAAFLTAAIIVFFTLTRLQIPVWSNSESLWRKAVSVSPDSAIALNNLGSVFAQTGRGRLAMPLYRRSLELEPNLPATHNDLGRLYAAAGDLPMAVEHYRAAIHLDQAYISAYNNLAVALFSLGRLKEAEGCLRAAVALDLDEENPAVHAMRMAAYINLGNLFLETDRPLEAVKVYWTVLHYEPDSADAHYNMGVALNKMDLVLEAKEEYQEALRLAPDHADARHNLEALQKKIDESKRPLHRVIAGALPWAKAPSSVPPARH